eukprot:3784901-Pleurochrysis_carterae.AAC.1
MRLNFVIVEESSTAKCEPPQIHANMDEFEVYNPHRKNTCLGKLCTQVAEKLRRRTIKLRVCAMAPCGKRSRSSAVKADGGDGSPAA